MPVVALRGPLRLIVTLPRCPRWKEGIDLLRGGTRRRRGRELLDLLPLVRGTRVQVSHSRPSLSPSYSVADRRFDLFSPPSPRAPPRDILRRLALRRRFPYGQSLGSRPPHSRFDTLEPLPAPSATVGFECFLPARLPLATRFLPLFEVAESLPFSYGQDRRRRRCSRRSAAPHFGPFLPLPFARHESASVDGRHVPALHRGFSLRVWEVHVARPIWRLGGSGTDQARRRQGERVGTGEGAVEDGQG